MRNASGPQCKVKMSGSEKKVNKKTYDSSSKKRVTKKFVEVLRCSRAKQRQRNVVLNYILVGCPCVQGSFIRENTMKQCQNTQVHPKLT